MTTEDHAVPGTSKSYVTLLAISAALVAPFIVLQWVNRRAYEEEFPFLLFTFMSLHALLIVFALAPALRRLRAQRSLRGLKLGHWVGLVLGAMLVCAYAAVVVDQLPCFLGVPNCD
jgi:drug/metabolite transporter (DMT)-like permease